MNSHLNFTQNIQPTLAAIAQYRARFKMALKKWQLPLHQQNSLLLSTHEWLTNLIQHAGDKHLNNINIVAIYCPETINIIIKDDGPTFTQFQQHFQDATGPLLSDLSESGRGLYLIKTMVPQLDYTPKDKDPMNIMAFTFPCLPHDLMTKPCVAIIEDNRAICSLITKYLEDSYHVKPFLDAKTFLDEVNTNDIDLVISDISMPDMDGLQLRHQLSQTPQTDVIPFIFLTSSEDSAIEAKALELGIDDYLLKPITKDQLLKVVKRVLQRKKTQHRTMGALLDDKVTATLRPQLPQQLGQYQCQVHTWSATSGGGDFIVHFTNSTADFVILGDVMGHGIDAKFFAHAYAGYIQGLINSLNHCQQVGLVLANLSELIRQDAYLESVLLTCIAIKLNANGIVSLASAGHPKPFILDQHGMRAFDISGNILGIDTHPSYEEKTLDLNNKRLIIYTDGLLEIGSDSETRKHNQATMLSTLKTTQDQPLPAAAESLIERFNQLTHNQPQDDTTLVMLECK